MIKRCLFLMLTLSACAAKQPQLVMLNPQTGVTANCPVPSPNAGSGNFLVSAACLSACRHHGFHPTTNMHDASVDAAIPAVCN